MELIMLDKKGTITNHVENVTIKIKKDKKSDKVYTVGLVVNFEGVTLDDLITYALRTIVISHQAKCRKLDNFDDYMLKRQSGEVSPPEVMVAELGKRTSAPATPESILTKFGSMSEDDRKRFLDMVTPVK